MGSFSFRSLRRRPEAGSWGGAGTGSGCMGLCLLQQEEKTEILTVRGREEQVAGLRSRTQAGHPSPNSFTSLCSPCLSSLWTTVAADGCSLGEQQTKPTVQSNQIGRQSIWVGGLPAGTMPNSYLVFLNPSLRMCSMEQVKSGPSL